MNLDRSRQTASDHVELSRTAAQNGDDSSDIGRAGSVRKSVEPAVSAKRLKANRNNAKKCTGPRSQRGKSCSRWNALKHGAYATQRLIRGEDAKAYQLLSERVFSETKPRTVIACMLVDQIIGDIWRIRRVEQAERAYLDQVRTSALSRVLRTLPSAEAQLAPDILGRTKRSATGGEEVNAMSVRQKLQSATHPEKVMLDGMVSADRAFPYSTLEQIRRSLLRDLMRKDSALAGLQAQRLTIRAEQND